jgi:hypothetical protein
MNNRSKLNLAGLAQHMETISDNEQVAILGGLTLSDGTEVNNCQELFQYINAYGMTSSVAGINFYMESGTLQRGLFIPDSATTSTQLETVLTVVDRSAMDPGSEPTTAEIIHNSLTAALNRAQQRFVEQTGFGTGEIKSFSARPISIQASGVLNSSVPIAFSSFESLINYIQQYGVTTSIANQNFSSAGDASDGLNSANLGFHDGQFGYWKKNNVAPNPDTGTVNINYSWVRVDTNMAQSRFDTDPVLKKVGEQSFISFDNGKTWQPSLETVDVYGNLKAPLYPTENSVTFDVSRGAYILALTTTADYNADHVMGQLFSVLGAAAGNNKLADFIKAMSLTDQSNVRAHVNDLLFSALVELLDARLIPHASGPSTIVIQNSATGVSGLNVYLQNLSSDLLIDLIENRVIIPLHNGNGYEINEEKYMAYKKNGAFDEFLKNRLKK